ncbi:MAG: aminoacyl-tRNA hydrolase [Gemmatimonadetes bacterium]|nr:aminoacyl-tRNA hydrolase [Gemmatimonadota bacterium]
MKVIVGLGNPGPEYDATRHNVGWWVLDRLAHDWTLGPFRRDGRARCVEGSVTGLTVRLVKPQTYVNRSGQALRPLIEAGAFDASRDLLVVVDDAALDVGRVRLRPRGSPGGHNGLKSIAGALGSDDFARLRVGVGRRPDDMDLADWVLSPMPREDEEVVVGLLPDLTRAAEAWLTEGTEAAMNRFNR